MVRYGMVRYGMVCYGSLWYVKVRYSTLRYGTEQFGRKIQHKFKTIKFKWNYWTIDIKKNYCPNSEAIKSCLNLIKSGCDPKAIGSCFISIVSYFRIRNGSEILDFFISWIVCWNPPTYKIRDSPRSVTRNFTHLSLGQAALVDSMTSLIILVKILDQSVKCLLKELKVNTIL